MIVRSSKPYPVVKNLGDIPSLAITQGTLGEVLGVSTKTGACRVRFPNNDGQGAKHIMLCPEIDFVFVEGDYSECFGYRSREEFAPWTFYQAVSEVNK